MPRKLPAFRLFREKQPKKDGFYVLRYREGHTSSVRLIEPTKHYKNIYSYFATYINDKYPHQCCDMGQYVWCNSYAIHCPTEWRKMSPTEALEFSNQLFSFGRPYWHYTTGRKPLTIDDVRRIQKKIR